MRQIKLEKEIVYKSEKGHIWLDIKGKTPRKCESRVWSTLLKEEEGMRALNYPVVVLLSSFSDSLGKHFNNHTNKAKQFTLKTSLFLKGKNCLKVKRFWVEIHETSWDKFVSFL
jgi:hypothetical protein